MRVSVLFSGGKDSSIAAILLERFFEVELVTCSFSVLPVGDVAREAAKRLGFPHRVVRLDMQALEQAYELLIQDGFPKRAIDHIHLTAIKSLALDKDVMFIADGIRRDDRVPKPEMSQIRSIEDRYGVSYMSPLKGFGRVAVNELVKQHLVIEEGQSENVVKADYETELRELIRARAGAQRISELFPSHIQSHVIERKKVSGKELQIICTYD
ncbi:ATP-binding protein [Methanolobus psychrophilus R15]|nr:ATP-binding protein [Methanolobus psychrophilus R15]